MSQATGDRGGTGIAVPGRNSRTPRWEQRTVNKTLTWPGGFSIIQLFNHERIQRFLNTAACLADPLASSFRNSVRGISIQTSLGKGVFNAYAHDALLCIQVFRDDAGRSTFGGRGNNERIPESNPGLVLYAKRR